jgi:hypothetical protein
MLAVVVHAPAGPGSGEDLQRFVEHLAAPPVIELLAGRGQLAAEMVAAQADAEGAAAGGAVFDRPGGPKPVRLTPLGALILGHGRDLLAKAAAMAAALDRFKAGDGRVDIGTFQSVSNVIMPPVVRSLRENIPAATSGCSRRRPASPRSATST